MKKHSFAALTVLFLFCATLALMGFGAGAGARQGGAGDSGPLQEVMFFCNPGARSLLPLHLSDDVAEMLGAFGGSITVTIPEGKRYAVIVYRRGADQHFGPFLRGTGKGQGKPVEFSLFGSKDFEITPEGLKRSPAQERITLQSDTESWQGVHPDFGVPYLRPNAVRAAGINPTDKEQPILAVYNWMQMIPANLENAVSILKAHPNQEGLFVTLQLLED